MNSPISSGIPDAAPPAARVGRLTPLHGVALRSHPDRAQLRQFLKELRVPLAAGQAMLDLVEESDVPESVRLAIHAVRNQKLKDMAVVEKAIYQDAMGMGGGVQPYGGDSNNNQSTSQAKDSNNTSKPPEGEFESLDFDDLGGDVDGVL